jgi:hypothetical protein
MGEAIKMFKRLECGCWFHWDELRLIDWEQREYVRGNFKMFGFWGGLTANVTLVFPVVNFIVNFKRRHSRLAFIDPKTAKELDPIANNALVCGLRGRR